jgi:hypothetical protein
MNTVEVDLTKHKYAFCIPAYEGKVQLETMNSLMDTTTRLTQYGVPWVLLSIRGSALIDATRNELCHKFLYETDADIMVCIDADIGWEWAAMERLLVFSTLYDTISGIYCSRKEPPTFHLNLLEEQTDANGLISHNGCGMGFTAIQRKVLEGLQVPTYTHNDYDKKLKQFFKCEIQNDVYTGEDICFFRELHKQGFISKADVNIDLVHYGPKAFDYKISDFLFRGEK